MTDSYYGRPVLKAPVWEWYIPAYFFCGGTAGASATLALAARRAGNRPLARSATLAAAAGVTASFPLLVADLGRPGRFLNMLRVFKPTSPMSVGTWLLAEFGPAAGIAAASEVTGLLPRLGRWSGTAAGLLGPAVSTYTAVLVADTAVPAWHDARHHLPFVFAGSSAAAGGGLALAATPAAHAGPARRLAVAGAALELAATAAMEHGLGDETGAPYRTGRAAGLARAARAATVAGAALALAGRRRRAPAVAAGALLAAGSLLTRFAVAAAGHQSALDPAATVGPQRARLPST
ncbi:MAG TPA: NrfD/PsrC family molybdoenzyme membrane anchor subunit [Acidimicrobiales bacterium]|nr:NrfD/PsrC family molybdoenzyme membrane anchor subunit [Acidimicrobiales bacterium]